MRLLHMYICCDWIETPSLQPNCNYLYWASNAKVLEELEMVDDVTTYPRVPISINPFKQKST